MYRILLSYLQLDEPNKEELTQDDWMPIAIKTVNYLRQLPIDIQNYELGSYHNAVEDLYNIIGNHQKAELHSKQAFPYLIGIKYEINVFNIKGLLDSFKRIPNIQLSLYIYITKFIANDGIWDMPDYYAHWQREQYELIEYLMRKQLPQLTNNQEDLSQLYLLIYCLKGIYYKRTRRFLLSESLLLKAIDIHDSLPETIRETIVSSSMLYLLLEDCYIKLNNIEKANACLKKAFMIKGWDTKLLSDFYLGKPLNEDEMEKFNNQYIDTWFSQHTLVLFSNIKDAINKFFSLSEPHINWGEDEVQEEKEEETFWIPHPIFGTYTLQHC